MAGKSTTRVETRINALVGRFRRQRPIRAGSLLITILGDAIVPRGGVIALTSLIELARPFGLTERHVRTSIGRLAHEAWVASQRSGRSSYYSLTPEGRARFEEATQRIYAAAPDAWNGEWMVVLIPPIAKAMREQVREELRWLGFGEIAAGVFVHPTFRQEVLRGRIAALASVGQLIVMQRATLTQTSAAQLAGLGWDFEELARRYRRLINMFEPVNESLTASGASAIDGELALTLRTLLLHEYRKIHLRDPLLPAQLLPNPWSGADALELCRTLYAKVFPASERYLTATVQTLEGALPQPSREIFARFGGLPRV